MLIQNNSSMAQASQPARLTSNSEPKVIVATPSNIETQPNVAVVSPQIAPQQVTSPQPSAEQLKSAIDVINKVMQQSNNALEFSVDADSKMPIVKLVDTETGELIRQFPTEETLAIARSINDFQQRQGLLLKHKA